MCQRRMRGIVKASIEKSPEGSGNMPPRQFMTFKYQVTSAPWLYHWKPANKSTPGPELKKVVYGRAAHCLLYLHVQLRGVRLHMY